DVKPEIRLPSDTPASGNGKPVKEKKESSRAISLELLREGKTVAEIATVRNLAKSTVEGHLIQYIVTGEVSASQFVTSENEQAIRNAIIHSGQRQAGAIYAALGAAFSYTEIRAVLYQLEREDM